MESSKPEISFFNWYVHQFVIRRKKHLLFTHAESLFSVYCSANTKANLNKMDQLFKQKLAEVLGRLVDDTPEVLAQILPPGIGCRFGKTNSRSILGSMNDLIFQIKIISQGDGIPVDIVAADQMVHELINQTPMSGIDYDAPTDRMHLLLGLGHRVTSQSVRERWRKLGFNF